MTRQEQIDKAAQEYAQKSIRDKGISYLEFVEACRWADRSMIEKVRQWLYTIDFDSQGFRDCNETFDNDLFIDTLCKVMEE